MPSFNDKFDQDVYAMSDNLRRYRAIRQALTQCYPGEISGRMVQRLTVLAAFISGIVRLCINQLRGVSDERQR
jgi:hypothetical protein